MTNLLETITFLITHSAWPLPTVALFAVLGFLLGRATWAEEARELASLRLEQADFTGKIAQFSLGYSAEVSEKLWSEEESSEKDSSQDQPSPATDPIPSVSAPVKDLELADSSLPGDEEGTPLRDS